VSRSLTAAAIRRRAGWLAYTAEALPDREPYRDIAPEQNLLREAAGHADQRAAAAEARTTYSPPENLMYWQSKIAQMAHIRKQFEAIKEVLGYLEKGDENELFQLQQRMDELARELVPIVDKLIDHLSRGAPA
jgi:hypothetical protein